VSITLTRAGGSSTLPLADTPAQFVRDFSGPGPWDLPVPDDPGYELFDVERQFTDGPLRTAHHADMTLAEVRRAVPPTSHRAPDQQRALDAALCYLALAADGMQDRRRRKLELWIRIHIWFASWGGEGRAPRAVSSPGRDTVCDLIRDERTGKPLSLTGYKRLRRFWEAAGFVAIVREGWTPDLSPAVLREPGRDHNLTQAYVICIPTRAEKKARNRRHGSPSGKTGPLSVFSKSDRSPTRAREENPEEGSAASSCYQPGEPSRPEQPKPAPREPGLRVGVLARVTDGWFRNLTRLFAGLTVPDLLWVVDHRPDGTPHLGTDDYVRHPAGWLRHRLSFWIGPDGARRPTPREEAAGRARRHRAEHAAQLAELGIAGRSARIRAERGTALAVPEPQRPWVPAPEPGTARRPGLASLARELDKLKQADQLDDQARAAAVGRALEARRAAPQTPHVGPGANAPAEPPAAAAAPTRGSTGGYQPDPEFEAAVAIAAANVAAWEAAQHAGEGPDD
jgi:hypothetical protein